MNGTNGYVPTPTHLIRSTNAPMSVRAGAHTPVHIRLFAGTALAFLALLPVAALAQNDRPDDLWQRATIYRDAWGVPHIEAQDLRAMAFAFGYTQAEDHLSDMLLAYRVANGKAAAVLGEAYEASDIFALKMRHGRLAAEALERADAMTRDLCEGFAVGVNTWLVEHPSEAPEWAEGVHPPDTLALWHAFIMSFAELDLPDTWQPGPAMPTANAWAMAPKRTEEGASLLVINPHQYHGGPYRWYEAHLTVGDMDVAGATLFGLPVIIMGHNAVLGWAMTPNEVDFADVFEEHLSLPERPANELRAAGMALERMLLLRYYASAESYFVRTDSGLEERFTPALAGTHGPVFEQGSALFSWRIGGYGEFGGLRQLVDMARATHMEMFQQAMLAQQIPCFNILYADRTGKLFQLYNATTGDRPPSRVAVAENPLEQRHEVTWKEPLPAAFADNAWRSMVPPGRLPYTVDPATGYLQACGSPPWLATEQSGLRADDWPNWFIGETDNYCARRVRQLLRAGRRSARDMEAMLYDATAPAAMEIAPQLVVAVEQRSGILGGAHPDLPRAMGLLRDWNGVAATDSEAMTFYHVWWTQFRARTAAALHNDHARYAALAAGDAAAWDTAVTAADEAVRMMLNTFQSVTVPWGRVHRIARGARDEPLSGGTTGKPIFLASDDLNPRGQCPADYGYGFAMVVSFGETPEAVSVVPFGASENPGSPHFDDQLDLLLEKRFKRARFGRDEVKRYAAEARGRRIQVYPLGIQGVASVEAAAPVALHVDSTPDPPAPLPEGQAAFTAFVTPRWKPVTTEVRVRYDFAVPPVICKAEHLGELRFQVWAPDGRWQAVETQQLDPHSGIFSAWVPGGATIAVLGPEACREAPVETEAEETDTLIDAKPAESESESESDSSEEAHPEKPRSNLNQDLPPIPE